MASADELIVQGREARASGDRAGAARLYDQACAAYELLGDAKRAMHALRHAAELRLQVGAIPEAQAAMSRVLGVYRAHGADGLEMANALRVAALAEEAAGSSASAGELWTEARDLYGELGIEAGVAEADRHLAHAGTTSS
jgi:tetratricopeptide (TPR) repeat protein